jgi:hypothetical protein
MNGLERLLQDDGFCRQVLETDVVKILCQRNEAPQPLNVWLLQKYYCGWPIGPEMLRQDKSAGRDMRGHARMDKSLVVRELCHN